MQYQVQVGLQHINRRRFGAIDATYDKQRVFEDKQRALHAEEQATLQLSWDITSAQMSRHKEMSTYLRNKPKVPAARPCICCSMLARGSTLIFPPVALTHIMAASKAALPVRPSGGNVGLAALCVTSGSSYHPRAHTYSS